MTPVGTADERRLTDLSHYDPSIHYAPQNQWSPTTRNSYNPDLVVNDLFFIPIRVSYR